VVIEPWDLASNDNFPEEDLNQLFIMGNQLEDDDFGDPQDNILYNQMRERAGAFNCDVFVRRDSHHNAYPQCGGPPDAVGPLLTGVFDWECTPVCWCTQVEFLGTTWSHPYICTRNFFPGSGSVDNKVAYYTNICLVFTVVSMLVIGLAAMYTQAMVVALYSMGWFQWSLSHVDVRFRGNGVNNPGDMGQKKKDDRDLIDMEEFEDVTSDNEENPFVVRDSLRDRFPSGAPVSKRNSLLQIE